MKKARNIVRKWLRGLIIRDGHATRIVLGPNRGMRMLGIGVSQAVSRSEPHLQRIIRKHVLPGMVVLDIGANVGFFTLMFSRAVGISGTVFAFEPIPLTFAALTQNLALNGIDNVEAINVAASDHDGELEFRIPIGGASMASYRWHKDAINVNRVVVKSVLIDAFKELSGKRIDFVKIDVEGAEGDVIYGMRGILSVHRPPVFIECSEIGREKTWQVLTGLEYQCFFASGSAPTSISFSEYRHNDFLWLPN
jgi:FkbM family methyltransferase